MLEEATPGEASTMVVMRGAAIMAGSALKNLAAMGSTPPTVLASSTVTNRAAATVRAVAVCPG